MKAPKAASLLAIFLTLSYFIASWYLSAMWATLVHDQVNIPALSYYLIKPLPLSLEYGMLHWQLVAAASLFCCIVWGSRRVKQSGNANDCALPLLCHVTWIVTALCLHIAGLLASFIAVAYKLA